MGSNEKGLLQPEYAVEAQAINERYLDFPASLDDPSIGIRKLEKRTKKVVKKGRVFKGFHFLEKEDQEILEALLSGEFNISGFRSGTLENTSEITRADIENSQEASRTRAD